MLLVSPERRRAPRLLAGVVPSVWRRRWVGSFGALRSVSGRWMNDCRLAISACSDWTCCSVRAVRTQAEGDGRTENNHSVTTHRARAHQRRNHSSAQPLFSFSIATFPSIRRVLVVELDLRHSLLGVAHVVLLLLVLLPRVSVLMTERRACSSWILIFSWLISADSGLISLTCAWFCTWIARAPERTVDTICSALLAAGIPCR